MISVGGPVVWAIFAATVTVMLALDLGVFHRKAHVVRVRERSAAIATAFTIGARSGTSTAVNSASPMEM